MHGWALTLNAFPTEIAYGPSSSAGTCQSVVACACTPLYPVAWGICVSLLLGPLSQEEELSLFLLPRLVAVSDVVPMG